MVETQEEVWFVLLQGEELGPLSFEEVLEFYYKDMVTSQSLLWREGWDGWIQLVQIPEFSELLFQGAIPQPHVQSQLSNLGGDTAFISSDHLDRLQQQAQLRASQATAMPAPQDVLEELEELEEFEELEELEELSLHDPVSAHISRADPRGQNRARSEGGSGGLKWVVASLLIGGLAWGGSQLLESPVQPVGGPQGEQTTQQTAQQTPQQTPQQGSSQEQRGGAETLGGAQPAQPSQVNQDTQQVGDPSLSAQAARAPAGDALVAPSERDQGAISLDQGLSDESQGDFETIELITPKESDQGVAATQVALSTPRSKSAATNTNKPDRLNKPSATSSRKPRKRVVVKRPKPTTSPKPSAKSLPKRISRKEFLRVIQANKSAFDACLKLDPDLKGTRVSVQLIVKRDGSVSQAQVAHRKVRTSPARACILKVVKSLKFPEYDGRVIRAALPVNL